MSNTPLKSLVLAAALVVSAQAAQAAISCEGAELVKPGKLVIAHDGNLPGTGLQDGKLIGIDGEILQLVADKLGLEVEQQLMEWSGTVESVRSRRVDLMAGMMGWTESRVKVLSMTDPAYYSGLLITRRQGDSYAKLEDLKGLKIGSPQGYAWNEELEKLTDDLRLYDTQDLAIRDLNAGRVDVVFLDPPSIQYIGMKQPELKIESIPIKVPFDPEMPVITGRYQVVFGMSLEAPKLVQCVNEALAEIWAKCDNAKIAASYGLTDRFWFTPLENNLRRGLDRDADWNFPTLGAACD